MKSTSILTPFALGELSLANRVVMAPMTRSRAHDNLPNDLMAAYYAQRSSAGLIVTEGVSPSPNGLGYARMPGIFTDAQTEAWKKVTDAVHSRGGKIFIQLMHAGRIAHALNLPEGGRVIAPSSIAAAGKMWTDQQGMQDLPVPHALDEHQLVVAKGEFVQAARNAMRAGFDGVELHSANGYLLEQFLSPHSNQRTDEYGGSIENRSRFVLEVATAVSEAIGRERTGIRLSPFGVFNDMPHYDEIDATYIYLASELNKIGLRYIHVLDHSASGAPEVPARIKHAIRSAFGNTIILAGGFNATSADEAIKGGLADLVAFGKPFISNPDFVDRLHKNQPLNIKLDASTFYTPGAKGYTDYPVYEDELVNI